MRDIQEKPGPAFESLRRQPDRKPARNYSNRRRNVKQMRSTRDSNIRNDAQPPSLAGQSSAARPTAENKRPADDSNVAPSCARLSLRLVPDRPVDFLVEWRAAGGELAHLIVFRSHQGRAIAEGTANSFSVQRFAVPSRRPKSGWVRAPRPIPTMWSRPAATFAAPASNA